MPSGAPAAAPAWRTQLNLPCSWPGQCWGLPRTRFAVRSWIHDQLLLETVGGCGQLVRRLLSNNRTGNVVFQRVPLAVQAAPKPEQRCRPPLPGLNPMRVRRALLLLHLQRQQSSPRRRRMQTPSTKLRDEFLCDLQTAALLESFTLCRIVRSTQRCGPTRISAIL